MKLSELLENYWLKFPAALYALGLIVHNIYLFQFGVYEFELVEVRYILSGLGLVGFVLICWLYTSIRVNLSYIPDSLALKKLLPWLLRIVSLPYAVYLVLYGTDIVDVFSYSPELTFIFVLVSGIAYFVVFYSVTDLIFMTGDGDGLGSRVVRFLFRVLSLPILLFTLFVCTKSSEFSSIFWSTVSFFPLFLGLALFQLDKKHGVELNYLDSNALKKHENWFQIVFGLIGCIYVFGLVVSNYTENIYPRIPAALGGALTTTASIYSDGKVYKARIINENQSWILFQDLGGDAALVKLRSDSIDKVEYQ